MNQQNAHKFLPLVHALADGKIIQEDFFGQWCDIETPSFHMESSFYRIKPEPRTFEIVRSKLSGDIYSAETYDGSAPNTWEYITVTEVIK
jgi:hypothetical protein